MLTADDFAFSNSKKILTLNNVILKDISCNYAWDFRSSNRIIALNCFKEIYMKKTLLLLLCYPVLISAYQDTNGYIDPVVEYDVPRELSHRVQLDMFNWRETSYQFTCENDSDDTDEICDLADNNCDVAKDDSKKADDNNNEGEKKEEPPRRALPAPFDSPPFPSAEYQGYPLVGVPPSDNSDYPFMQWLSDTCIGKFLKDNRVAIYGWVNGSANGSSCHDSNMPFSYWLVPNKIELDHSSSALNAR